MNKRLFSVFVVTFVFSLLLMTSVTISSGQNLEENELIKAVTDADIVVIYDQNASTNINVDGVIGVNEYPESFYSDYVDMTVSIAHNGSFLFVGMTAPTTGYIAIGINEKGYGMVGSDIKYGYVKNGNETTVGDNYAKIYGFPLTDPTKDIAESAGTEKDGVTVIEMVLPMVPKDLTVNPQDNIAPDRIIEVNNSYALLFAWGKDDGMSLHHKKNPHSMFIAPKGLNPRTGVKTSFQLTGSTTGDKDTVFQGSAKLTDSFDVNLAGKEVSVYLKTLISDIELTTGITDSNGNVNFNFTVYQEYSSTLEVYAVFKGDLQYKKGISDTITINYTGYPAEEEEPPFLAIPKEYDFIVPYMTGFGALAVVIGLWTTFGYVIYTVLFLNAKNPEGNDAKGGNEE